MFEICIDENGFYKEGIEGELVEVSDIPIGVNLTQFKYNRESKTLELAGETQDRDADELGGMEEGVSVLIRF